MKNWIRSWLGLPTLNQEDALGLSNVSRSAGRLLPESRNRNYFEIIPAVNGKIVVYTRSKFSPNGPDQNDMEVFLVHEGDNLMDTITTAIVSAGLK